MFLVEGDHRQILHKTMAAAMDQVLARIRQIQGAARTGSAQGRELWLMIVLATPKGWTGPKAVDGLQYEGTWRIYQVPLTRTHTDAAHRAMLADWMRSYRPEELFDADDAVIARIRALTLNGSRHMSANPHANGGLLRKPLTLRPFVSRAVEVTAPGASAHEPTRIMGRYLLDVMTDNSDNFRIVGLDETASNRLDAVYAVTDKVWQGEILLTDEYLALTGQGGVENKRSSG